MTTEPTDEAGEPAAAASEKEDAPAVVPEAVPSADVTQPPEGAPADPAPALPDTAEADLVRKARVAFAAGDFRRARELASGAAGAADAVVRDAAAELLGRTRLDPVQVGIFAVCLALFLGIAYWFVLR